MGALAGLLKAAGHEVRGSDTKLYPPMSDQLAALEIPVADHFSADNLAWGPDRVVVGNVCRSDHPEVVAAQERKIPLVSLPGVLEEQFLSGKIALVVAGTHGKTTTSSVLAHILLEAGRDPSFFLGGVPIAVGRGWRLGGGDEFVLEGDEYDSAFFDKGSKFFHYQPKMAILSSVELDHVDIFAGMDEVRAAFRRFVALIPKDGFLAVASSSPEALAIAHEHAACRVETYSFGARGGDDANVTWHGSDAQALRGGRCRFDVTRNGERYARIEVNLSGEHNLENVMAAIAIAHHLGIPPEAIRRAVASFAGVRRRQEVRGIAQGVNIIDDYAHHPTAVTATLKALASRFSGRRRLIALFEPRSATSRRRTFQNEFVDALAHADSVVVGRLYAPETIDAEQRLDPAQLAFDLHRRGTPASYIEDTDDIVAHVVEQVRPGDVVVVFSSGTFDGLHDKLLIALGDAVMPAQRADLAEICRLLEGAGLDWRDIKDEDYKNFLVLRNEVGIVGCIGLEVYGEEAILRSLVVSSSARGHGYGWMLADNLLQYARYRGVRRMYLLTPETASDFFAAKLGFRVIDVSTVSDAVAQSSTFRSHRGRSPMTMRLDL
jgi:UDP-N-acetylmuramate: L-alanyl-gamma-D-glutamyl-meso-diaminopimelate ligase